MDEIITKRIIINEVPKVNKNLVEVVRCKDCKYAAPNGKYGCSCYHFKKYEIHEMTSNDYCSHGERKGGEE